MRISDWSSDVCSSDLQGPQMPPLLRIKPIRQTPPDGPLLFRWQGQNASVQPYIRLQQSGACAKHRDRRLPPPDAGRLAFFRDQREILVRSGNQIVGALPQYAAQAPPGGGKKHLPVGMPCIRGNGKAKDRKSVV